MIRTTLIPDTHTVNISLSIPESYIGKEMEVIAFSVEEGLQKKKHTQRKVSFDALSIDTLAHKFDRDEANKR